MNKKLKVYESTLNVKTAIMDENLKEAEFTEQEMFEIVRNESRENEDIRMFLIYPGDVPGKGVPIDPDIDRETFEGNPMLYGIALYKNWANLTVFE